MKHLLSVLLVAIAMALTTTTVNAETIRHIGVVAAKQTPEVDKEVLGRNADQYFFSIYKKLNDKKKGFEPAASPVKLQVRSQEGAILFEASVTLNDRGWAKMTFDASILTTTSLLCVQTPWPIAHQRLRPEFAAPDEHIMCEAGAYEYLIREGGGKTARSAKGVIAIQSAG